ncbi:DsrH/TusB family sulfur relay protein [Pseudoalteromonas sp. T1lg48]|uniref:DsrH/TusB family sulfur relay protein n=1 Tax=Pseudoalteromonas sp. T1lg48 TaxID=2077100 RepID=UPI000CF6B699|nr:DsrH/TusB family sulfur metabolism protein [Pseudoalteromonas sp. T1lg48]
MNNNNLFILHRPFAPQSLLASKLSKNDALLLRGDACYNPAAFSSFEVPVYALKTDVDARGAQAYCTGVHLIDDLEWVTLTLQYQRCISE